MEDLPLLWIWMQYIGMKNNLALLGGTFDPVHIGHIKLFHNVYSKAGFTHLIVIPAYISNFKQETHPASFQDRVEMLKLAILDYKEMYPGDMLDVEISTYEGDKKGVSYTSETIKDFYDRAQDDGKVNFIIGDDILPTLNKWHDFDYLKENVRFFCFPREGKSGDWGAEVVQVISPLTEASSSQVRSGEGGLLSKRVKEYVDAHQLYRSI